MVVEIRDYSIYGNGFALLPWAEQFRSGRLPNFPDSWLAVFPVILAHANKDKEAWPGYSRLCALAQVGRSTLHEAINGLVERKWLTRFARKTGGRTHNVYRMTYNTDDTFDSRRWIALHNDLTLSGVWGKMRSSDRKVYLMLRAFAWHGGHAIPDGFVGMNPEEKLEVDFDGQNQWNIFHASNFLPAQRYDPATFQRLSGMNPRTWRDSFSWLLTNQLIIQVGHDDNLEDGFLMPFRPGRYVPSVVSEVQNAKDEKWSQEISPGSKRSFTRARQRQRQNNAGKALSRRDMLDVSSISGHGMQNTTLSKLRTSGDICPDSTQEVLFERAKRQRNV